MNDGPYRGHTPMQQAEAVQPAFYVIRLRKYEQMANNVRGYTEPRTVHDLAFTRHETQEEATKLIEALVKSGNSKSQDFLLLYGYLAQPTVEVTREVLVNVNTSFKQV